MKTIATFCYLNILQKAIMLLCYFDLECVVFRSVVVNWKHIVMIAVTTALFMIPWQVNDYNIYTVVPIKHSPSGLSKVAA